MFWWYKSGFVCQWYSHISKFKKKNSFTKVLEKVNHRLKSKSLTLIQDKTQIIKISKILTENFSVKFYGHETEQVQSVDYLGIFVNEKLTFNDHIQFVSSKITKQCRLMYRIKYFSIESTSSFSINFLNKILLQFGVLVYGCTSINSFTPILKL